MHIGARVDQLRIYSHPVTGAAHRAFEHVSYAERLADLAQVAHARPVLLNRCAADDLQVRHSGETGENVVMYAIGKKSILAIVAQVLERKDRDAFFRQRTGRPNDCWFVGALDSLGSEVVSPGKYERDRKAESEQSDDRPHNPVGNVEKGKGLRGDLDEEPGNDGIGDRNAVNFPSLRLEEKCLRPHSDDAYGAT